jgi:hypothetical protein
MHFFIAFSDNHANNSSCGGESFHLDLAADLWASRTKVSQAFNPPLAD